MVQLIFSVQVQRVMTSSVLSSGAGARQTFGWSCLGSDLHHLLLLRICRSLYPAHSSPWGASHTYPPCSVPRPCTCPRSSAPSPSPGGRGDGHSIAHHGDEEVRGNHDLYRNPYHSDRGEVSCHNTCPCHHICLALSRGDGRGNDLDDGHDSRHPRVRPGPV